MTVRLRLALTIFVIGVCTALGVLVTVAMAFQRFEHETTYERANAFVGRVVSLHPDLLDLQMRDPVGFTGFLRNLLLFEPDSQLYLLDADGNVLAASGRVQPAPGFKVRLEPVKLAVAIAGDRRRAPYVMGDDPEHMNLDAVIAARPLRRTVIRPDADTAGYLYLVCQPPGLSVGHVEVYRSSLMGTSLLGLAGLIVAMTLLAAWIVATVTRPLRDLSDAVARAQREGFDSAVGVDAAPAATTQRPGDEFVQLRAGFHAMLTRLRSQWDALRRLDQFRRESVSNLSHDLRSPLTATVACLETLDRRWAIDPARADDRAMLEVALRNTRNAAQLVRSLGDLA
ncbi:MAG TPA: histidine kinase dimerization/phospho-acceptor domain-containing protein, partial [Burkholderiaceae bacterium]|nr:histidine kinase dimerization/phospho-acceptor domain-containing protein [Burkholderiaceae bacterium]